MIVCTNILFMATVRTKQNRLSISSPSLSSSSLSSSVSGVAFMKSKTTITAQQGKDAMLECSVRNLASHHTVCYLEFFPR